MNAMQRVVLAIGLLGVCASILFVPYEALYKGYNSSSYIARAPAGYSFLATAPSSKSCVGAIRKVREGNVEPNRCSTRIDTTRIALQLGALATLVAALTLFAGLVRRQDRSGPAESQPQQVADRWRGQGDAKQGTAPASTAPARSSFVELLLEAMPGLPVSKGDLREHTPLVITDDVDHVSVEYQVMTFIIDGDRVREYRRTGQRLLKRGMQRIDVLTYVTRPVGAKEWGSETVDYYFDITAGFNRMSAQFED